MKAKHLQVEEGISNWLLVTIILSCAAPAITLNVWPRVESLIQLGWTSNQFGIVLLVMLSALGMTCVPFAMKKAENWGFWLTCLVFGIGLAILNYTMAVGAVGKSRDEEVGTKTLVIQRATLLRSSISESENSRRSLPPFKWTTQDMVSTASKAVDLAREARDQECGKIGDICRARVTQLANRQAEQAALLSDRATTGRAMELDRTIEGSRRELFSLGAIPESNDQQASRIASILGTMLTLGQNASEKVATGLIHFLAICAEAFALGMPRIIVTALAKPPMKEKPRNAPLPQAQPPPAIPKVSLPIPRPKPLRSPNVPMGSSLDAETLEEWKRTRIIPSTGRTRTWDVYSDYQTWAKANGRKVLPFQTFDSALKRLGIKEETDPTAKRDFYLEVAIKQPLKAVS